MPPLVFLTQTVASLLGGPVGVRVFSSPDFQGTLMLLHGYGGTDPADPECFTNLIRLLTDSVSVHFALFCFFSFDDILLLAPTMFPIKL